MARKKTFDFSGVETYARASEGRHRVKIREIREQTTQGGDDMLVFVYEVIRGEDSGALIFENCVLTDKALWKLKQVLQAIGIKCEGKVAIDIDKLVGRICEIDVFHEEYEGKVRVKISEYYRVKPEKVEADEDEEVESDESENEESEEPEESEVKPVKKAKKPTKKEEPIKPPRAAAAEDPDDWEDDWDDDEDE